jgi:hypothetical protein
MRDFHRIFHAAEVGDDAVIDSQRTAPGDRPYQCQRTDIAADAYAFRCGSDKPRQCAQTHRAASDALKQLCALCKTSDSKKPCLRTWQISAVKGLHDAVYREFEFFYLYFFDLTKNCIYTKV